MNESTQSDENTQAPWPGGIAAITLFVEDMAAAKDFYTDVASHTGSDMAVSTSANRYRGSGRSAHGAAAWRAPLPPGDGAAARLPTGSAWAAAPVHYFGTGGALD